MIRVLCVTGHSDIAEAHMFVGLAEAGVSIEVMCPDDAPHVDLLRNKGVRVTPLKLRGRFDQIGARLIRERLMSTAADILHVFNNNATSNGLRASRGLPVKIVAYRGIEGNVSFFDPFSWTTYLHPRVDRIICVAEAIRQYLIKMRVLGWRFPAHKAVTIYKGHDLSWYGAPKADLQEFGIPEGAFVVGSVANLRPRKGIPVLIEATRHLPADANIHLLLVGKMEDDRLPKMIARSPMRDRIHLAGFRRDAPALMGACDIYVLPALKREGLPKTVIEAMAHGVPPVVTDAGGSPELIEANVSGVKVPPGDAKAIADAALELYADAERRTLMGQAARKRLQEQFHVSTTVTRTFQLYQELTAEHTRTARFE